MAKKKRKGEFAGIGCLLQFVALILLFFFPIGTICGVVLFIYGSTKSFKFICSDCGNPIEKTSKLCPVCKEAFV